MHPFNPSDELGMYERDKLNAAYGETIEAVYNPHTKTLTITPNVCGLHYTITPTPCVGWDISNKTVVFRRSDARYRNQGDLSTARRVA